MSTTIDSTPGVIPGISPPDSTHPIDDLYRLTVDEYERLAEAEVLKDRRVELINGLLVKKMTAKPAHVIASLRIGGSGFVLGTQSAIGIDTVFAPPPAPVLGRAGNVRLNRMTVLRRGRPGRGCGFAVGLQPLTE